MSTGFIFFFGKGLKNFFIDFRIKIGEQKKKGNKQFNRISDQPRQHSVSYIYNILYEKPTVQLLLFTNMSVCNAAVFWGVNMFQVLTLFLIQDNVRYYFNRMGNIRIFIVNHMVMQKEKKCEVYYNNFIYYSKFPTFLHPCNWFDSKYIKSCLKNPCT